VNDEEVRALRLDNHRSLPFVAQTLRDEVLRRGEVIATYDALHADPEALRERIAKAIWDDWVRRIVSYDDAIALANAVLAALSVEGEAP